MPQYGFFLQQRNLLSTTKNFLANESQVSHLLKSFTGTNIKIIYKMNRADEMNIKSYLLFCSSSMLAEPAG